MSLQHLNLKLFLTPATFDPEPFIAVFNQWIQAQALPELLIDVADYRHVPAGPGLLLMGHEANYSLDNTGNRWGLLYNRKAPVTGSAQDRLLQATAAVLHAAQRLERENGLRFNAGALELVVNDRLLAPNTPETFAALQPDLQAFGAQLYAGQAFTLTHRPNPRARFTVQFHTPPTFTLAELAQHLTPNPVPA